MYQTEYNSLHSITLFFIALSLFARGHGQNPPAPINIAIYVFYALETYF